MRNGTTGRTGTKSADDLSYAPRFRKLSRAELSFPFVTVALRLRLRNKSTCFQKLIATSATWGTLPIRMALAAVMIAHGSQKVLGTFNGSGFNSFIAGTTPFSFMRPAWLWLAAAALSELVGGLLIGVGFLTRRRRVLDRMYDVDCRDWYSLVGRVLCLESWV